MQFQHPALLILLLALPLLVYCHRRWARNITLIFSACHVIREAMPRRNRVMKYLRPALRSAVLALIVLSLARPVRGIGHTKVFSEGIDIILAIDISSSMDARDMTDDVHVNRLDVVKEVVRKFVSERENDRIGIVAFARYAYTQAPLTLDHGVLVDLVDRLNIVPRGGDEDGTAIGSALMTSVARLKESDAKSRVIILLTDGMNNRGEISPESAADVAASLGIRIYTIGAGTEGMAPYPVKQFGRWVLQQTKIDIDEESLSSIAEATGADYFRAQDERGLMDVYEQIDRLEKVEIEEKKYLDYQDLYPFLLLPAFLLLLVEIVAGQTVLRRLP